MKKSVMVAGSVAALAALWVFSGIVFPHKEKQDLAAAPVTGTATVPVQVRVRDIAAETMTQDIVLTGRTKASRQIDLRAETAGQIAAMKMEEGATVVPGDVIVVIEVKDRKARTAETQERVRQRETEFNAAQALESKGYNSKIRLAQARADLEAARAALKEASTDLGKTEIKAPFEGVVYGKAVDEGDYVAVGDSVYSLADLDPIEMTGFVSERQVGDIKVGGPARAVLVSGQEVTGTVSYVAPAANPQTRTFAVKLTIANPDSKISEGMTAEIHIPAAARQAHRISPSILSLADDGTIGVKAVNDRNIVQFIPVRILADQPDAMWVGGLPDKVRLITVGQDFVSPGQTVAPVQAEGDGLL